MTPNLVHRVSSDADLNKPREITRGLLGEPCWKAALSYGDELRLEIGARVPTTKKSMKGSEKGAWMFGTRQSDWTIESQSGTLVTSHADSRPQREKLHQLEGTTIVGFEISYPSLIPTVSFSNGYTLTLLKQVDDDSELPYWELFTPYRMVLKVGPKDIWSYVSTDSY